MSEKTISQSIMTPKEIVHELDRFIIGQGEAKKKVAIALRDRWRRLQLGDDLRNEVTPKNILMIGPTGVGKTEIARRLAKLAKAPFIKIEATKFTEVGYVGRDVETIIRDLVGVAYKMEREEAMKRVQQSAEEAAQERILDILLPPARSFQNDPREEQKQAKETETRKKFRDRLNNGELDEQEIEVEIESGADNMEIMAPPGMEELTSQLSSMFQSMSSGNKKKRKMKIKDALNVLQEEEAAKLIDTDEIKQAALRSVEDNGIVFLDELDKVAKGSESSSSDVSREGVQRDLLPLIEGSTVSTKYGSIKTDHILFIASGAFYMSKPSDLVPELQGRLPIRVELKSLDVEDFERILTEPTASLTEQYTALIGAEEADLQFTDEGIRRIAEIAWQINDNNENIGARRLHTVMEKLLEEISYSASEKAHETITIDREYVDQQLGDLIQDQDLTRYVL